MINSVRNTVLSILNKNNYGYLSPSDFNLYAKQAQMEFFDEYFSNYNKVITMENTRMSGTDYADIRKKSEENMEVFLMSNFLHNNFNNRFFIPSLITTGDVAYMISKILYYNTVIASGNSTSSSSGKLINSGAAFVTDGIVAGDIVLNATNKLSAQVIAVDSQTQLSLSSDIFTSSPKSYKIISSTSHTQVEKVTDGKISMLNASNLTAPSTMFPAYVQDDGNIVMYPVSINSYGNVFATYFRFPKDPKWTYQTLANGEPVFDQSQPDYQDFELQEEDEYKLVMKILQYAGMSIREIQAAQFGIAQEQHEQPTFSQKQ